MVGAAAAPFGRIGYNGPRARAGQGQLTEHGIDLPYPTQQILFHDQTEESDGDRSRQREGWPADRHEATKPRSLAGAILELGKRMESNRASRRDGEPQ